VDLVEYRATSREFAMKERPSILLASLTLVCVGAGLAGDAPPVGGQ